MIGRDHLDSGSVASPYRETEAMADGSDAIADWPLLNALVNTAAGASWVSIHHGGGVGIGRSIHAGMVCVADGTDARRAEARAGADRRSRDRRHPPRRRGLRAGARGRRRARRADPDARGHPVGAGAPVSVREIVTIGDPVLRERAREVERRGAGARRGPGADRRPDRDDAGARTGPGSRRHRSASRCGSRVIEVDGGNPRYPYKPPIPLTVIVNPELEPVGDETVRDQRGLPLGADLRGDLDRARERPVRYLDRDGERARRDRRGLTAGTFQHEVDHLDGVLFVDRVDDPSSFTTWEQFERHQATTSSAGSKR